MLLAWRRPAVTADAPAASPPIAPIPGPERLPTGPDFDRVVLVASERPRVPRVPITVKVRNLSTGWRTQTAGVAIVLRDGSSSRVWLPLANATTDGDALVLAHELAHAGEIVVALATAPTFATHSYLARRSVEITTATTIDLDASAAEVTFRSPAGTKHSAPLLVRRADDAFWLPMDGAAAGLELTGGAPARLWLGNGAYEISDPLRPEVRQAFAVPQQTAVEVTAGSSPARADRP